MAGRGPAQPDPGLAIARAARRQIGITLRYDPAYRRLDYPLGDVPSETGVCTDVVIRALRTGVGLDLQQLVHEDMRDNFSRYPSEWGLRGPDRSIDHRRVPNLRTFFRRRRWELAGTTRSAYRAGALITCTLPGNLPHIMIASDRKGPSGNPTVIHNIGRGAREEDRLVEFPLTGHYRVRTTG